MANDGPFNERQVREFVKQAKREWGCGWGSLGERFQHALIVERAAYIMAGQASETITPADVTWLIHSMLVEEGLEEDV